MADISVPDESHQVELVSHSADAETVANPLGVMLTASPEENDIATREPVEKFFARLEVELAKTIPEKLNQERNTAAPLVEKAVSVIEDKHHNHSDGHERHNSDDPPSSLNLTKTKGPIERLVFRAREERSFQNGKKIGYIQGVKDGKQTSKLERLSSGMSSGHERGKLEDVGQGHVMGRTEDLTERTIGRREGFTEGYAIGRIEGFAEGKHAGREEGFEEGKTIYYGEGIERGKEIGRLEAMEEARNIGYELGILEGKIIGREETFKLRPQLQEPFTVEGSPFGGEVSYDSISRVGIDETYETDAVSDDNTIDNLGKWFQDNPPSEFEDANETPESPPNLIDDEQDRITDVDAAKGANQTNGGAKAPAMPLNPDNDPFKPIFE
ncbi:hypothetical protein K505DRAFT_344360 [Melanomma pulvis-pyrius CBS 109.77]|uniref:Essential protein Yae1 N-terminal domain-containing protein n=1 Tax=Melanomma pulvis-pyrius CBS 109.77 TaxID=1314802 RepID=A0A6A6WPG2_9PLEO|nr:hypothetical protein K505DRAFT_344360 [Melanomma pulvis-pyrius CBS 109.77]